MTWLAWSCAAVSTAAALVATGALAYTLVTLVRALRGR